MRSFFDPSPSLLQPSDMAQAFTKSSSRDLSLPSRAIVVVNGGDLNTLVRKTGATRIAAWSPYRSLFRIPHRQTVMVRSPFGGPNMAVLVEELACFGVEEICFWGYCGGIREDVSVGDRILVDRALRDEGTSYHYLPDREPFVSSGWHARWQAICSREGFMTGPVWSCDAPYRETQGKVEEYSGTGVLGVEMEVASLYAVCAYRGVKGIAFVVVSDLVTSRGWSPGFSSVPFKEGARSMAAFILEQAV